MKAQRWLWLLFLMGACLAARAQRADGIYNISCMVQMVEAGDGTKKAECTTHPSRNAEVGIQGKVGFEVTTTQELMDQEGAPEVTDLILFLDGQALPGTHPVVEWQKDEPLPGGAGEIEETSQQPDSVVTFRLSFPITRDLSTDKGRESWKKLLGGLGKEKKEIAASVGLLNGPPLPSTYKVEFVRLGKGRLTFFIVIAVVLGIGFWLLASKTGALRDKEPPAQGKTIEPQARTYSLSRTQVAIWTLLVVYAYLFIFLITGEYNTQIPGTILAILGLSAGTFVTAAAVDKDKENTKNVKVENSSGMAEDLFAGASGAALHRVQFGLWSVVLMVVFVVTTYETLAMPQFNNSLLGLMGLSSITYAGMKIPETKN